MHVARRLLALLVVFTGACSTQPRYERPPVELPAAWKESAPRFAADGRWWRIYEDTSLDSVIEESTKSNADFVIAAARVDEARAVLGETRSGLFPQVDAQGAASRQRSSRETATAFAGVPREFSNYRATVNVSYELDLFGRLRAGAAAARAELEASEASREAVRLAPAAQVAKSYFALRSLRAAGRAHPADVAIAGGISRAAAEAPRRGRDLGIRAAPARGRGRRGARAAAAARARAGA